MYLLLSVNRYLLFSVIMYMLLSVNKYPLLSVNSRVEMSTDFATWVPDIHYPTGTRVLVTVNLVSD